MSLVTFSMARKRCGCRGSRLPSFLPQNEPSPWAFVHECPMWPLSILCIRQAAERYDIFDQMPARYDGYSDMYHGMYVQSNVIMIHSFANRCTLDRCLSPLFCVLFFGTTNFSLVHYSLYVLL